MIAHEAAEGGADDLGVEFANVEEAYLGACAAAIEIGVPEYRFVRRWREGSRPGS